MTGGVSLINIYHTLADLSGLTPPDYLDGFSLAPHLKDPSAPLAGPARCTWGRGNVTVRDEHWRYTRYYDGTEELYDHREDPQEWTNRAGDPDLADVRARLAADLPETEVPLIREGIETWSLTISADKPLKN